MVVRVKGSPDAVQIALDNYIRITSTSSERSVEDLRRYYYNRFLGNLRADMKDALERKMREQVVKASGEKEVEESSREVAQEVSNGVGKVVQETSGGTQDDSVAGMNVFRNLFRTAPVSEEKPVVTEKAKEASVGETLREEVHGTFIEDMEVLKPLVSADEISDIVKAVVEKSQPIVHGTFVEDIKVAVKDKVVKVEEKYPVIVHGVYIEDIQVTKRVEEKAPPVEKGYTVVEEKKTEVKQEVKQEPVVEEKIVREYLPPTVRAYLKTHNYISIEEVKKYYPLKQINHEIRLGKIIRRGNKLCI